MKNLISLAATAALMTFFVSCSKDEGSPAARHTDYLPVAVVETYSIPGQPVWRDSSLYTYDPGNRLKKVVSVTFPGQIVIYRYNGDSRFGHDDFRRGSWSESENFWIDNQRRVDSSFHYDAAKDSVTGKYVYNGSNQRTEKIEYYLVAGDRRVSDRIRYSYNKHGDILTEEGMQGTVTYTYVKDRLNSLSLGLVFSPGSVYLVHSKTVSTAEGTVTIIHSYRTDRSEHLLSDTAVSTDGSTDIKAYYY